MARESKAKMIAVAFLVGAGVGIVSVGAYSQAPKTSEKKTVEPSPSKTQQQEGTGVFINEKEAPPEQLAQLKQLYGMAPPKGRYWYDSRSGLYGMWGFEAAGYIRPGHDFGIVPAQASRGNTGVFINGREINLTEALFVQSIFGAVYQGRWWLDGHTGNVGLEPNPMPLANVVVALQQSQRSRGRDNGYRWRDNINNFSGGAENGCVWVNIPGGSYTGSGC
jgi:hypothetical protein